MKERPILFSSPMVRAILDGRKTQTRRVVKGITDPESFEVLGDSGAGFLHSEKCQSFCDYACGGHEVECPYGKPGDRLCVREAWKYCGWSEDGEPKIRYAADGAEHWPDVPEEWGDRVQDIWAELSKPSNFNIDNVAADRRWRSSRFMPRWASRLTLEITGVRVERLQSISEADAIAEGVDVLSGTDVPGWNKHARYAAPLSRPVLARGDWLPSARYAFDDLWESINGPGSWAANPWVWVVEFRRIEK